jgi:electron-transferring-flavoprotein dehydrogenase
LKVKDGMTDIPVNTSLKNFAGPEQRFCPAKVYEFVENEETKESSLVINA